MHTVALTKDGTVYTFGCNDEGALGRQCVATDDLAADEVEALPSPAEGLDGVHVIKVHTSMSTSTRQPTHGPPCPEMSRRSPQATVTRARSPMMVGSLLVECFVIRLGSGRFQRLN